MTESAYSMFSNFQSIVMKAVKAFLSKPRGEESNRLITTTLRIPGEIKEFYECLAEAEMSSLNTAIVSTLVKVKDYTLDEYQNKHLMIKDAFNYQIDSVLKIIETQRIEINDLTALLSWASGKKISRSEVSNKENLIDLIDKEAQLKLCNAFGYQYDWLKDNSCPINYWLANEVGHWYKNINRFIKSILLKFSLDETVDEFELSFLCSDKNVVRNILSKNFPSDEERITPIIIADRTINGVKTKTYHCLQSENINYEKCRSHFIVLINLLMVLVKCRIVDYPKGIFVPPQQHDMLLDGKLHVSHLFKAKTITNDFLLDNLEGIQEHQVPENSKSSTSIPNAYHALDTSILDNILNLASKEELSVLVTDELISKLNITKVRLIKYLNLLSKVDFEKTPIFNLDNNQSIVIDLEKFRAISLLSSKCKVLYTAFG